jgi:hypothetical protein
MAYGRKIILQCPSGYKPELDGMVEDFIRDGVAFVGVVGEDCAKIEEIIDELVVGDGSDESRSILTSSHPGATTDDALDFAQSLSLEYEGEAQVVVL